MELDYGFDYRQTTMTADEYAAALFLDSLEPETINHLYDFSEEA